MPKLDFDGGGNGNGNHNRNGGGGDGGGGDDDDDDFFGEDDGEGGDGGGGAGWGAWGGGRNPFWRAVLAQLYDPGSLAAVMAEWGRAAADLPAALRASVGLGLFSSAELIRFLAMDVRPGAVRSLTRALPPHAARGFVGRLMADPAFAHKLAFEVGLSALWAVAWEAAARGPAFWSELDFVALNTVALAAAGAAGVCVTAPSRAMAGAARAPWAAALAGIPNHAFEAGTPGRALALPGRLAALAARGGELAAIGGAAGAAMAGLGSGLVSLRRSVGGQPDWAPSVPVPSLASAGAMAATGGLVSNARLQLLGGVDRVLSEHAATMAGYLAPSLALRAAASWAAHETRLAAQGLGGLLPAKARAAAARRAAVEAGRPVSAAPKPRVKRLVRRVGAGGGAPALARGSSLATAALAAGSAGEAEEAGDAVAGGLPPPSRGPPGGDAVPGAGPPRRRKKKKAVVAEAEFSMSASA